MNKILLHFFEVWAGPTALLLSIVCSIVLVPLKRNTMQAGVRKGVAGLLFWPSFFLAWLMVMHLGHNGFNALVSITAGQAKFAFYHYGLLLFGSVTGYQAIIVLRESLKHVAGSKRYNSKLYLYMGRITLTTLPTWFFMPLAPLPTLLMIIALVASVFTHRKMALAPQELEAAGSTISIGQPLEAVG